MRRRDLSLESAASTVRRPGRGGGVGGGWSRLGGATKRTAGRRACASVAPLLAARTAAPRDWVRFCARLASNAWFMKAWGCASVKPEEAQTATAPPVGERIRDSARLRVYTSWKNPFRQSINKYTGRRWPLVRLLAAMLSRKSANDHCSVEP